MKKVKKVKKIAKGESAAIRLYLEEWFKSKLEVGRLRSSLEKLRKKNKELRLELKEARRLLKTKTEKSAI